MKRCFQLIALALILVAPFLYPQLVSADSNQFEILDRWATGNKTLRPITFDGRYLFLAGESTVEAWDTETGHKLWMKPLHEGADFRPRLAGEMVLVNAKTYMTALDRKTGEIRWSYNPDKPLGTPYYHNGRIIIGVGHLLTSIDSVTGEIQWTMSSQQAKGIWYAPTAFGESHILAGFGDGILYSLSAKTGRVEWTVAREKEWQYLRQLYVSDGVLVAGGYKDNLFGIDAATGKARWYWYSGNFINSHLVFDGATYLWSPTGWVYSINARTGKKNWRTKSDYFPRKSKKRTPWAPVMAEIVADKNGLYVLDMKNVLHILDHKTGKETASIQFTEKLRPFVALVTGAKRLFLGNTTGEILHVKIH
ncbi:MAG: PQQ-binding-like beta-propeller repeat protein [Planctomycetes bacterium]|nr:PQQ-binding-like beta-propeller repeat protein [Planctomycetota bacterium]